MEHLDDESLAAAAEGGASPEALAHLADCGDCRGLVLSARRGLEAPRRSLLPRAAAAAVLLLASAWTLSRREALPPARSLPVQATGWRRLSSDLEVETAPGARLIPSVEGGRLEAGEAWWTQGSKGASRVEAGGWTLRMEGAGAFGLRLGGRPSPVFLRAAEAADEMLEVWVAEGAAKVSREGRTIFLSGGQAWRSGEAKPRSSNVAGAFAWREGLGLPARAAPQPSGNLRAEGKGWGMQGSSSLLVSAPAGASRLLAQVQGMGTVSAGVSCQRGEETAVWELPASLWDGHPHALVVESSPLGVRVRIDGGLVRSVEAGAFRANRLGSQPGMGLVVWGGKVDVAGLSLRVLEAAP